MDRRAVRRLLAPAVLVAASASVTSCALDDVLPPPECDGGGTVILVAQSVPGADLVPCFDPLPAGWVVASVTIDGEGTVVRFDSDRAGEGAAIFRYGPTCDLGRAVPGPSEYEGAQRYELVERVAPSLRARRTYVFDGGCVSWDLDFADGAPAALSIELGDRLALVPREELNRSIRENFVDADL